MAELAIGIVGLAPIAIKIYEFINNALALKEECLDAAGRVKKFAEDIDKLRCKRTHTDGGNFEEEYLVFQSELEEISASLGSLVPTCHGRFKRARIWRKTVTDSQTIRRWLELLRYKLEDWLTRWNMHSNARLENISLESLQSIVNQGELVRRIDQRMDRILLGQSEPAQSSAQDFKDLEHGHQYVSDGSEIRDPRNLRPSRLSATTRQVLKGLESFFCADGGIPTSMLAPFAHAQDLVDNPPQPEHNISIEDAAQECESLVAIIKSSCSDEEQVRLGIRLLEAVRTLSRVLYDDGECIQSLAVEGWVLRLCESFVKYRSDVFLDDLARCEQALSRRHAMLGHREDAYIHAMHAMSVWRDVVEAETARLDVDSPPFGYPTYSSRQVIGRKSYKGDFVVSLLSVSEHLANSKHHRMSLRFANEAVVVAHDMNVPRTEESESRLAECLLVLHYRLWADGSKISALEAVQDSLFITEKLWNNNDEWRRKQGMRHILAKEASYRALIMTLRHSDAAKVIEILMRLRRQLIWECAGDVKEHSKAVFAYLKDLSLILKKGGSRGASDINGIMFNLIEFWDQELKDKMEEADEASQAELAKCCKKVADAFASAPNSQDKQTTEALKRAIGIYKDLVRQQPSSYLQPLAMCQAHYSRFLVNNPSTRNEALTLVQDDLKYARQFDITDPLFKEYLGLRLIDFCLVKTFVLGTVKDEDIELMVEFDGLSQELQTNDFNQWLELRAKALKTRVRIYSSAIGRSSELSLYKTEMCVSNLLPIMDQLVAFCRTRGSPSERDKVDIFILYSGVANAYHNANLFTQAMECLCAAARLAQKWYSSACYEQVHTIASMLVCRAIDHLGKQEVEAMEKSFDTAISIARKIASVNPSLGRPMVADLLSEYANLLLQAKKPHRAFRYLEEAIEICEKYNHGTNLSNYLKTRNTITLQLSGRYLHSQSHIASTSARSVRDYNPDTTRAVVLAQLAMEQWQRGSLNDARQNLKESFNDLTLVYSQTSHGSVSGAKQSELRLALEQVLLGENIFVLQEICKHDERLKQDFILLQAMFE